AHCHPPALHPFPTRRSSDLEVSSAGVNNRGRQGAFGFDNDDGQFFTAAELEPGGNFPNLDVCRDTRNGRCVAWWENRPQFTGGVDRKSTRLNSSHVKISYAV